MRKKIMALITVSALTASMSGCGSSDSSSSSAQNETTSISDEKTESSAEDETTSINNTTAASEEKTTTTVYKVEDDEKTTAAETTAAEATTEKTTAEKPAQKPAETKPEHVSQKETVSATLGTQVTVDKTIGFQSGSNTIKIPLADLIEEGDEVNSFTFIIYSADGKNIGEYKGACGISVNSDCTAATDEGWYQSENFTAPTQGTYGEITWKVPGEIKNYISAGGELLFGYWWGDASSIRIDCVICSHSRTKEVPVDGTASQNVGKSVSFDAEENTIKVPTAGLIPDNAVPEVVTYNISSSGSLGKFTGAFGYNSSKGYFQSNDTAVMTEGSNLSLTWFVPAQAKVYAEKGGELVLGYWWSKQPSITLDSVTVKYSLGDGSSGGGTVTVEPETPTKAPDPVVEKPSSDFRSSTEIAKAIKVGWNLGNSLDSYNTGTSGLSTETGWGNPKTTKDIIKAVKKAGFNAVRIPATWGEHMNGDKIDSEWLARAKEVVDYAYNEDMFVIINMHHDDYIWFEPLDSEYSSDSAKLKAIWTQLANYFKDYGDRLLFEGMNEPRNIGSANEWMGGTAEERAVVSKYELDFVDTVRKTGGNNSERTLIITSYAASAETSAINDVVIPNSKNIILSVHYYAPWQFSDGTVKNFDDKGKSELDAKFAELKQKFIDKGVPVIIGEFGCVNAADVSVRKEYYRYYISSAKKNGIKCFVWDNNIFSGDQSFGLLDRNNLTWKDGLDSAIKDGAK